MLLIILKYRISILLFFIFCSCLKKEENSLLPKGYEKEDAITIENSNLKAVFVDNSEIKPDHMAGYNGIAQLYYAKEDSALFVPAYAGFNLEHIFGGDSLEQLFEPRKHPMKLFRKADNEVLLYQEKTPLSAVESLVEFKVVAPHYIDITFNCILHDDQFFRHGYAGLFFASYMNNPEDKKIYFKGVSDENNSSSWIGAWSDKHGVNSTHRSIHDNHNFFFAPNFNASLASNISQFHFTEPYYFGRFGEMALAFFFDTTEVIRFSQSPTGGGEFNPAWDFQYIIPDPQVGKRYSFKTRIVYKPFVNNDDISREYKQWKEKI